MTDSQLSAPPTAHRTSPVWTNLVILLVGVAGMFAQYRYSLVERLILRAPSGLDLGTQTEVARARLINTEAPKDKQAVSFDIFWEVWDVLENNYVDPAKLDTTKMVDGAVSGMTASLEDPYTAYLPPKAFERTGEDLAGAFYGVGIELGYKDGVLAAVSPLADSPADKAGVKAGDLIIRVKDEAKQLDADSSQWPLSEAVEKIRGPKGSQVILTLVREGAPEPFPLTLTRDEIVIKSAEVSVVDFNGKKAAHVKLSRFGERTTDEWSSVVSTILKERPNISGVILDMRNNPGGLFDDAVTIASDFIPEGVLVSQQGRQSK